MIASRSGLWRCAYMTAGVMIAGFAQAASAGMIAVAVTNSPLRSLDAVATRGYVISDRRYEGDAKGCRGIFSVTNTFDDTAESISSYAVAAGGDDVQFGWSGTPAFEAPGAKLARTPDPAERHVIAVKLQRLVYEKAAIIPLCNSGGLVSHEASELPLAPVLESSGI